MVLFAMRISARAVCSVLFLISRIRLGDSLDGKSEKPLKLSLKGLSSLMVHAYSLSNYRL